jgi:murein DD-endopeptidase MepM/ murein hydrolase activator NlpD
MHGPRRLAIASVTALALLGTLTPAGATESASDGPSVRNARARVEAARARAAEASQAYLDAEAALGRLDVQITAVETRIPRLEARVGELRTQLEQRAAVLYVGGAEPTGAVILDTVVREGNLIEGPRIAHLAGAAQDDLDDHVDDLESTQHSLEKDRADLQTMRAEQEKLVAEAAKRSAELEAALQDANENLQKAEARQALTRYLAAVAAQQAAAEAAALAASQNGQPPPPDPREQTPPADPALAAKIPVPSLLCPTDGAVTFWDDWGQPRSGWRVHQGTDIFAPRGTPDVAIADGVAEKRIGGLGGNTIWLYTDDGNAYYYAHLDGFAGSFDANNQRRVVKGEVIGYVGNTGNAAGGPTHTHFEIRPQNVGPVNPYPMLKQMCAVQGGFVAPPPDPPVQVMEPSTTTTTVPATTTTPTSG